MSSPSKTSKLDKLKPLHAPQAGVQSRSLAQRVYIPVKPLDHSAPAILHAEKTLSFAEEAVILVSGAGGGVSGPGGIYVSLADKLAKLAHVPVIRLDYREPAKNEYCTPDVLAAMDYLKEHYSCHSFVLCGWSFGSAPAISSAAADGRVAGVALVAPQTADTNGISKLAPRPLLLLHGTGDSVLSDKCSRDLYEKYGNHGDRTLKLFEGDDHGLTTNALEAEKFVFDFAVRVLGKEMTEKEKAKADLYGDKQERVQAMKDGHDLEKEKL